MTPEEFWARVRKTDGCWYWTRSCTRAGYGQFGTTERGGRGTVHVFAHRFAYEISRGPIPAGLEVDHLCGVKHCVRPDHLKAATHQENTRRGIQDYWHRRRTSGSYEVAAVLAG